MAMMKNHGIRFIDNEAARKFEAQVKYHRDFYRGLFEKLRGVWRRDETHQLLCNAHLAYLYIDNILSIVRDCGGKGRGVDLPQTVGGRWDCYDLTDAELWRGEGI